MMNAPGKKVCVLGIGKSGFQSALFLKRKGFKVFASDQENSAGIRDYAEILKKNGIETETGGHTFERILSADWILISPGIPPAAPIYQALVQKQIPILSEIEVASWYCPSRHIIAVTGSSGKTTVTTLLARVFQKAKGRAISCGNIGNPWIEEIQNIRKNDFVVVEVSSFQLMHCQSFRPEVGILLNLAPNHQDWHKDMNEYVHAKLKIFQNQKTEDVALIREADRKTFFPDFTFKAGMLYFRENPAVNPNEDVVRKVAQLFECPPHEVDEVLAGFEGIEHRLEKVCVSDGVSYVNDSKCTTTASLIWALEKFPDASVVLIAGGHPKSDDFHTAREWVRRKVKYAVLIGEARPLLKKAWEGACPFFETNNFRSAIETARAQARQGNVVLLSPACASFDMFKNYEERGALFKKIVANLTAPFISHV